MNINQACKQLLWQLSGVIYQISNEDFSKPSEALSRATIGQHLRHTLEFFICFQQGYYRGVVDYDHRAHDRRMETDKQVAIETLESILDFLSLLNEDRSLVLRVDYALENGTLREIPTNAARELVYNIEHTVHHMALMKIGIREVAPYISLPADFGVAVSTLRHSQSAAIVH
jgi:uncharacterized damage-inducible protein DinB